MIGRLRSAHVRRVRFLFLSWTKFQKRLFLRSRMLFGISIRAQKAVPHNGPRFSATRPSYRAAVQKLKVQSATISSNKGQRQQALQNAWRGQVVVVGHKRRGTRRTRRMRRRSGSSSRSSSSSSAAAARMSSNKQS